ncbi:protein NRT1/ PTR FAMILY 5.2-like [Punica granatum]|uniref:Protein NRT1/ PTR FAMILY 5.2-like n=3 Tax=Punica granatum TaxID=22663 RepID=A0A6P8BP89_PUNGR|nr:protein NRT1/ PTR FAMILY 5.2-like [Punica granatum]XP_031372139.1 protein NRT1/ PTR FAMILY 5.2-like [Punica granatum]
MEGGRDDYTEDGTVDLKGKPIRRSRTGRWRACSFIVVYEIFERAAYWGIASNLVMYLSTKLHQGTVTSSSNVTDWVGATWLTPIIGAYIADAYLGRYWTFMIGSAIYLSGMSLLTLAVWIPQLQAPTCEPGSKEEQCNKQTMPLQVGIFYGALYLIAVGNGGTKPNISTIGAEQFDEFDPKERIQKLSFFNWWMFSIFFGQLFAYTILVYVQDNVGWALGYGIPTIGLAVSILIFISGTPFYRHKAASGSPFTRILQVLVAALRKWNVAFPNDPKELHELPVEEYTRRRKSRIEHTPFLRFLDKAAVKTDSNSPWLMCPVTHVEETKQMIKMIPILITTFVPSMLVAQVNTLFVKQGATLDRSMGPNFKIPPASLGSFLIISMLIGLVLYDRCFLPFVRRHTKNPRGITLLQRMGIGLGLQAAVMVIACFAEKKRLAVAKEKGIFGKGETVPLSIFILLPQFVLLGFADAFAEPPRMEFFYDQAPQGMKSLGTSYFTTSMGIGNFLNSFVLKVVASVTKMNGHQGWILDNLNRSRLDLYYLFLAILILVNFLIYLLAAKRFVYNADVSESDGDLVVEALPNRGRADG